MRILMARDNVSLFDARAVSFFVQVRDEHWQQRTRSREPGAVEALHRVFSRPPQRQRVDLKRADDARVQRAEVERRDVRGQARNAVEHVATG